MAVQPLEDRTVPAVLLNEVYLNPPGPDDNRVFVELIGLPSAVTPLDNYALVEINGNAPNPGVIVNDRHLDGQSTGTNGLLLLTLDYTATGNPWGSMVNANTVQDDLLNDIGNDNVTILLVQGYTGISGQDLDTNDDGTLDVMPWTSIADSVGWLDPSLPGGRVYSPAALTQTNLSPDAVSRFAGNQTPQSTSAWYNGEILAQGGTPDLSVTYNSAAASANLPAGARITPGDVNLAAPTAAPTVTSIRINDGAAQRSRVASLTVTFDSVVVFGTTPDNAFTLTRAGGGAVTFTAAANVVNGVTVVTIDGFSGAESQFGSLRDGRYTLTVLAAQITSGGLQLNNGTNTSFGDAQGLFRYFGDVNGDRRIDIADFGAFSASFNRQSSDPGFNPVFDFNNDGRIDISDFGQFSVRYFTTLP